MQGIRIKITTPVWVLSDVVSKLCPFLTDTTDSSQQDISTRVRCRTLTLGMLMRNDESITQLNEFLQGYAACKIIIMKCCQQAILVTFKLMQGLAETWCAYMISRLLDRPDMTLAVLTGPLNQLKQKI